MDVLAGEAAVAALGQVVEPGLDVLREPQADVEAGRHALEGATWAVRRDATRIGAGVGVAEEDQLVAGAAQLGGERLVAGVERRAVGDRAVVAGVEAGQQRGAGGAAGRGLAVVAGEGDGLVGEAVEDGRAGAGVAQRAQRVATPAGRVMRRMFKDAFRPACPTVEARVDAGPQGCDWTRDRPELQLIISSSGTKPQGRRPRCVARC